MTPTCLNIQKRLTYPVTRLFFLTRFMNILISQSHIEMQFVFPLIYVGFVILQITMSRTQELWHSHRRSNLTFPSGTLNLKVCLFSLRLEFFSCLAFNFGTLSHKFVERLLLMWILIIEFWFMILTSPGFLEWIHKMSFFFVHFRKYIRSWFSIISPGNQISPEGVVALAEALRDNSILQTLNLSGLRFLRIFPLSFLFPFFFCGVRRFLAIEECSDNFSVPAEWPTLKMHCLPGKLFGMPLRFPPQLETATPPLFIPPRRICRATSCFQRVLTPSPSARRHWPKKCAQL